MPRLAKIIVYPIKSFDGVELTEIGFMPAGALANDRRFALKTVDGKFVNGKKFSAIHRLRAEFDLQAMTVTLTPPNAAPFTFELAAGNPEFERWCSDYFGAAVRIVENTEGGFPDDGDAPGATLISTPTLAAVTDWFPPLDVAEMRRRFAPNLEIEAATDSYEPEFDCPAFWEDRLFTNDASPAGREVVEFRIGDVVLQGVNPCARCAVPTRDSQTGEIMRGFAQVFSERRRAALPTWASRDAFDHFYRLSVNTRLGFAQGAKTIHIGDRVEVA